MRLDGFVIGKPEDWYDGFQDGLIIGPPVWKKLGLDGITEGIENVLIE